MIRLLMPAMLISLVAAVPTIAAVPTTAVPTATVPTTAVPTTAVPAATVPTATPAPRPGAPPPPAIENATDPTDPTDEATNETTAARFGWPLPGRPAVARLFEQPAHRFGPGHRGVDLAAPVGTPVLAAGAGVVVFAGAVAGRTVVSVDHPGGLRTTYEPVTPAVRAGDMVSTGQRIGTLDAGHPGCAAAACLHWGVRRAAEYLDPLRLLGLGRVRLLPWQDAPGG